ncbi:MAG: hypothetical protein VYD87_11720 [Pseudomonadota bacterium]|nr:hypothetical protein [Pseudomonadota bacterium]MEE3100196.1 hypothetical protein [Pseudomonadota bacterium]
MPVIINEFEIVADGPSAPAAPGASAQPPEPAPAAASGRPVRPAEVVDTVAHFHDRARRLRAT